MVNAHGRFIWYGLMTPDMESAKAFYTKLLGWSAPDASIPDPDFTVLNMRSDAVAGFMRLSEEAADMGAMPMWIGYVGVDDVDATARQVQTLGGIVHVPPTDVPEISRFAIISDPQMATLALFKWRDPSQHKAPQVEKSSYVGWHELLAEDWEKAFAFYSAIFGWQKADAEIEATGTYQTISIAGQTIGGMFTKPAMVRIPFWLYYFNVADIDTASDTVKSGGGQILEGPVEGAGGRWTTRCLDPQGAMFALQGPRRRKMPGYFEDLAAHDPSKAGGRRWSW
jgi:uncharacterized protein